MTIHLDPRTEGSARPAPRRADPLSTPLSEQEASDQARLLKALADPTRLRLVDLFLRHTEVIRLAELGKPFILEQPTLIYHLRILRDAGLVECHKQDGGTSYSVRRETLARAQAIIGQLFQPPA